MPLLKSRVRLGLTKSCGNLVSLEARISTMRTDSEVRWLSGKPSWASLVKAVEQMNDWRGEYHPAYFQLCLSKQRVVNFRRVLSSYVVLY